MREYSVPATVTVSGEDNLSDMVFATAERFGGSVLYRRKVRDTWVDVTAREFAAQVLAVAKGLIAAGVEPGDRVALLSRTRYEWTLVDFAILAVGGVTVPIYDTSAPQQIEWILSDSGASAAFVETAQDRDRLAPPAGRLATVRHPGGPARHRPGLGLDANAVPAEQVAARRRPRRTRDLPPHPGPKMSGRRSRAPGCDGRPSCHHRAARKRCPPSSRPLRKSSGHSYRCFRRSPR